ncbi:MAG: GCN5 family acetyltransferase [Proteobacteria bacterium SG_bin6]|nr:MAG: GCN5 family acetyltransferase [Proteobacteria bacterium SG_bin6]
MIETDRLVLRWPEPRDRVALHAMWADPRVMADLGPVKDAAASDATLAKHEGYRGVGLGFWAVERKDRAVAIGFCGLKPGAENTPIAGALEIGWIIAAEHWGQGFASEAARASLAYGWLHADAHRIVAITAASNTASRGLMARLGMAEVPGGMFDHPLFEPGDRLRRTVTYAIDRP